MLSEYRGIIIKKKAPVRRLFEPEAFHLIKSIANTLLLLLLIPLLQTL